MLQIKRASQNFPEILQSTDYQALINIKVLPQIDPHSTITKWVAIEARWDHELIGLALCEIYPLLRATELKSINIKSNFRQKGIGRQLFAFLEDWLVQKEQVQSIEVIYDQSEPECIYLEKILIAQGWDIPNVSILRCHFDSLTFNPPWLHYSSRLPTFINFFLGVIFQLKTESILNI